MTISTTEFVALCTQLREMGATEISAGEFSAKFPATLANAREVPRTSRKNDSTKSEPEMLEGDTPEDRDRRNRYAEVSALIAG